MTRKKPVRKHSSVPEKPPAGAPPVNPLAATPEQIAAAQEQARQRQQMAFDVLKQKFAEESIQRTIAESQSQQLIERLQAAQVTIEKLTEDNRKLQAAKPSEEGEAQPDAEPPAPEADPAEQGEGS